MTSYIIKRILAMIPTLFGVTIATFLMLKLIPGTIVEEMLGVNGGSQESIEALRQFFGLNQPLYQQYWNWISGVLIGHFGVSWRTGQPIVSTLLNALSVTGELAITSVIVSVLIGIPLGILAAVRPYGVLDNFLRIFSLAGVSIPVFFQGTLLILIFSLYSAWSPPVVYDYPWDDLSKNLQTMILPSFAMGLASSAVIMRMTRSALLETLGQDFIRTSRSKGLSEKIVIFRHALRTVMISVVTAVGLQFGQILGGIVVIEVVFNLPGVGQTIFNALIGRDYPVVQSGILLITLITLCLNTVIDLTNGFIDPRVRHDS